MNHKCRWCHGEVVQLAVNGPGSTVIRVCEICDGGLLAHMWAETPEEGS